MCDWFYPKIASATNDLQSCRLYTFSCLEVSIFILLLNLFSSTFKTSFSGKLMFRTLSTIFFLACISILSFSQDEIHEDPYQKFDHYSTKDGLPHNKVLDIFQDSHGYIWVATYNGLSRFDGYNFHNYFNDPDDSTSLSANLVSCLTEDLNGNIWIGSTSGLNKYDGQKDEFINKNNLGDLVFDSCFVRALYADKKNNLWVETANGQLKKVQLSNDKILSYSHNKPSMVNTYLYHTILEDSKGNIWVGGRYMGIYSFDPEVEKFRIIPADPDNKKKKRDPDVAVYFIDSRGSFWVGGTDGLYLFDAETEIFTRRLAVSTFTIAEGQQGKIWIGTGGGLYTFLPEKNQFLLAIHDDNNPFSLCQNHINKIFIDKPGNVWIGTNDGISIYRPGKNKFRHIHHIPGNDQTPESNHITSILEDKEGNIWLGTSDKGVDVFDPAFEKIHSYSSRQTGQYKLASNKISVLKQDQDGDVWIGQWSGRGMNVVNPKNHSNTLFRFLENALKADWYGDILHDRANNHWIGMWGAQGLYRFDKDLNSVTDDRYAQYVIGSTTPVKKLAFDGRRLWIAYSSQDRFYCFDTRNSRFTYFMKENYYSFGFSIIENIIARDGITYFNTNNGVYKTEFNPYLNITPTLETMPYTPSRNIKNEVLEDLREDYQVNAVIQDEDKIIWVGTNKGLIKIDEGQYTLQKGKELIPGWTSDTIYDLALLPDKRLILGTERGFMVTDLTDMTYSSLNSFSNGYLSSRLIKFLYEDQQGAIWIGTTENGVSRLFPNRGQIINYLNTPEDSSAFWGNEASCAVEDVQGSIWIGGSGLNIFDPSSGTFSHLTAQNGLASNHIRAIQKDKNGDIWAASSEGLSRIDPNTFQIHNYYEKDGLQDNEFAGASFTLRNGQLAFAGKNGLNLIDPDNLPINILKPEVRITSFKIFEEEQKEKPADGIQLNLKYKQNYFSFEFTALDYSDPANNLFAYKLEGIDEDWIHTDATRRVARYTNIDPGKYVFRVIAANSDGIWNEQGISIPLSIKPPFWKTTIFYIALFLVGIGMLILWIKYRENKIRKQNKVLLLEQKLLRSQMNPHFIFNSLSSIQSFIFENNPMTAGSYLSQFAELIRSILYNSREEYISLDKELKTLKNYMELQQLRYNNKFDFHLEVDPDIDPEEISIPPMLAQPFIENAIEHGVKYIDEQGSILVNFNLLDQSLALTVEDNGIGLEAAKKLKNSKAGEHTSLATIITRERIDILNKSSRNKKYSVLIEEIKEENTVRGTRVKFMLPLIWRNQEVQ